MDDKRTAAARRSSQRAEQPAPPRHPRYECLSDLELAERIVRECVRALLNDRRISDAGPMVAELDRRINRS